MVTSGFDILKGIGISEKNIRGLQSNSREIKNKKLQAKLINLSSEELKIYNLLKVNESLDSDQISQKSRLGISMVNQVLTAMELDEIIVNYKFNRYKLRDEYCE